jgi:uncharacterized protein (PEP-CTERM system associated)
VPGCCRSESAKGDDRLSSVRWVSRRALVVAIGYFAVGPLHAERWTATASADVSETYNHYTGEAQPNDDFVTSLTAGVTFDGEGARLRVKGTVAATEHLYTGQGQTNSFAPSVNVTGHLEAIEKFFFVDAGAFVTQTYVSPFGPQPGNITTPTNNRYTLETYNVSPYIQGRLGPEVTYSVRDDNAWTTSTSYGGSSVTTPTTYWNNFDAQANYSPPGRLDWVLDYNAQYYDPGTPAGTYVLQLARAIGTYRIDPQLDVSARIGYEKDRFPQVTTLGNSPQGPIYGVGAHWRPTDRTDLNGYWEEHYYGSNYSWALTHRLPNVALRANFTRGLTSYPQLALLIPAGVDVAQFLDLAFTTRIPDPVQRQQAIAQFLAQTGLPPTLSSPLNVYAQTLTLQNTATFYAVWVGALNAIGFSLFRVESTAISGQGSPLPPPFQFGSDYTQSGAGVNFSHQLSGRANFIANVTYSRTTPHTTDESVSSFNTNNFNATAAVTKQFSPKTSAAVGVSYFIFETPGSGIGRQNTLSIYGTLSHTF